jgi:ech hydrogenase subunit C
MYPLASHKTTQDSNGIAVVHFDCGGCNGCDIEIIATLTRIDDIKKLGITRVGSPSKANTLVATGPVNHRNKEVLKSIYDQLQEPKLVFAVGTCACTGGLFHNCRNTLGGIDKVVPVDVYIPGCAVRPEQIIHAVKLAVKKLNKERKPE